MGRVGLGWVFVRTMHIQMGRGARSKGIILPEKFGEQRYKSLVPNKREGKLSTKNLNKGTK